MIFLDTTPKAQVTKEKDKLDLCVQTEWKMGLGLKNPVSPHFSAA